MSANWFWSLYEEAKDRIDNSVLKEKNNVRGPTLSNFKIYYKATVIMKVWYCGKNRQIDEWSRIESPEIDPHIYNQLIFDKKNRQYNGAKTVFLNKWCWNNWTSTCKKMNLGTSLTPFTKLTQTDHRLKCRIQKFKTLKRLHRKKT